MEQIILSALAKSKLSKINKSLHSAKYFGTKELAKQYTDNILDFIYTIPSQKIRVTKNNKYGNFYCSYKHNKRTTWFITFDIDVDRFLVKNILNNHTSSFTIYIKGVR